MITIASDIHLYLQNRIDDFKSALDEVAEIANTTKLLILLGDVYHHRKPEPEEMNIFRDFLKKVKVPVEMIIGNHDIKGGHSALDEFWKFSHDNIQCRRPPYILQYYGLNLYLNHCSVEGAEIGPCDMVLGLKEEIKIADLKKLACDFYLCGHIHKAQVIADNIIYPGSIERVDFGERNEKKYVVLLDEQTKKFEFRELHSRPMIQRELDLEEVALMDVTTYDFMSLKDAIVKLVFTGTKAQINKFDDTPWKNALSKVSYSYKIVVNKKSETSALSSVTEQISENNTIDKCFDEYATMKKLDAATVVKGKELLHEFN
jgi:DNA repair exonuclease SbcCD nuclease subunit